MFNVVNLKYNIWIILELSYEPINGLRFGCEPWNELLKHMGKENINQMVIFIDHYLIVKSWITLLNEFNWSQK
jgi:hypothetical protein